MEAVLCGEAGSPETNAALVFGVDEGCSWPIKDSPGWQTAMIGDRTPRRGYTFNAAQMATTWSGFKSDFVLTSNPPQPLL